MNSSPENVTQYAAKQPGHVRWPKLASLVLRKSYKVNKMDVNISKMTSSMNFVPLAQKLRNKLQTPNMSWLGHNIQAKEKMNSSFKLNSGSGFTCAKTAHQFKLNSFTENNRFV